MLFREPSGLRAILGASGPVGNAPGTIRACPGAFPRRSRDALGGSTGAPGRSRNAPGRSADASHGVLRAFFWTSTLAPVSASLLTRFWGIPASCAGRPTGVTYAFLQVETPVAPFALREHALSGNAAESDEKQSEFKPEIDRAATRASHNESGRAEKRTQSARGPPRALHGPERTQQGRNAAV